MAVREAGDHRVVHYSISHRQWRLLEDILSEGDVTGGGVAGDHGGSGDFIRFGDFVEQVARVTELRRFGVDIDQTVEDVGAWLEPEGDDVGVDGTCELERRSSEREAEGEVRGVAVGYGSDEFWIRLHFNVCGSVYQSIFFYTRHIRLT